MTLNSKKIPSNIQKIIKFLTKIKNQRVSKIFDLNKKISLFILFSTFNLLNCQAEILEVDNFAELKKEVISRVSKESLVLFDVDDVLIKATEEFDFRSPVRMNLKKELANRYNKIEIRGIFTDYFLRREVKLVNDKMPSLITELKNRKIFTSALSAWWTEKFGKISEMEQIRLRDLKSVGLSFSDISPFKKDIVFSDKKRKNNGSPMVISGIILTAVFDKGEVLEAALNNIDNKFEKIIFIDDNIKYIHEVEKFCNRKKIAFTGIHYTEASKAPIAVLDEQMEKRRFDILEQEHIWLLDSELKTRTIN